MYYCNTAASCSESSRRTNGSGLWQKEKSKSVRQRESLQRERSNAEVQRHTARERAREKRLEEEAERQRKSRLTQEKREKIELWDENPAESARILEQAS